MKAAQVLLLLIAFIAASHLRREVVIKKGRMASMQQQAVQIAANTQWPAGHSSPGYAGEFKGLKAASQQSSFITTRSNGKNY